MLTESGCAFEYRVWGARVKMEAGLNFGFAFIPLQYEGSFREGGGGAGGTRGWILERDLSEQRIFPCSVS